MSAQKGQVVSVEIAHMVLYWTCPNPNCKKENCEDSKRNGHIAELECEECKTVIIKRQEAEWIVE